MINKIKVLSKALELGSFEVSALAAQCGVSTASVYTVLNRAPAAWFSKSRTATGLAGGQPKEFKLTDEGRAGIAVELGRLPVTARMQLAPRAPDVAPLGLKVALASVPQLQGPHLHPLSDKSASDLLQHIRRNLDWADEELNSAPATTENARHRLQLDLARELVAQIEQARAADTFDSTDVFPVTIGQPAGSGAGRSGAPVWSAVNAASSARTGVAAGVRILIGVLGADDSARRLAYSAEGAVRTAAQFAQVSGTQRSHYEVSFFDFGGNAEQEQVGTVLRAPRAASAVFPDILLCVNSQGNAPALTRSLDRFKPQLGSHYAVILDVGRSSTLARYAQSNSAFDYRPHADTDFSWMLGAFLRDA
jgi:hypothetical protein